MAHCVQFIDGTLQELDAVILATGYRALLGELIEGLGPRLNERGCPGQPWYDDLPGLYFLGFSVPLTGILRSINIESGRIVKRLLEQRVGKSSHN